MPFTPSIHNGPKIIGKLIDTEERETVTAEKYQLFDDYPVEKMTPCIARPQIMFDEATGILTVVRSK